MITFLRIIQLDDDSPSPRPFKAASGKVAIKAALEELQSVVETNPGLVSAVILVGQGSSELDAQWLGGWVWKPSLGFVRSQPD